MPPSYGLYSYELHSCALYCYGLYSYGLCRSQTIWCAHGDDWLSIGMAPIVMANIVMAYSALARIVTIWFAHGDAWLSTSAARRASLARLGRGSELGPPALRRRGPAARAADTRCAFPRKSVVGARCACGGRRPALCWSICRHGHKYTGHRS